MPAKPGKINFTALIQKFGKQGEKTGWTYIGIKKQHADLMKPGCKVSFRVKGKLDACTISQKALLPMGDGHFVLVLNAPMRRALGKTAGQFVRVELQPDDKPLALSRDFILCLKDEPGAYAFFKSLPRSHQQYFSNWIESARTLPTRTRRIAMALEALAKGQGYGEMIREHKGQR